MIANEPSLSAYLDVMIRAITRARFLAYQKGDYDEIADLLDTIHIIPELINAWERCDTQSLFDRLVVHDKKWKDRSGLSLVDTFMEVVNKQDQLRIIRERRQAAEEE